MRVAIDLTALLPEPTGVDTYMLGLVRGLSECDPDSAYTLFVNAGDAALFRDLPPNFSLRARSLRPRPVRLAFQQLYLPALALAQSFDVVHSPAFISPLFRGRQKHLLSIHDMTSFSHPDCHIALRRSRAYRSMVLASIRRADRVTVPSDYVAEDVRRWIGGLPDDRVQVDRPGVDARFWPLPEKEIDPVLARLEIERPYFLFVGTLQPRKNLLALMAAYSRLVKRRPDAPRLVLAGRSGWEAEPIFRAAAEPVLAGRVLFPGYVAPADLPALYAGAYAFVFPSLAEGFGFPPLEAMACGTPVIASDTSALRENLAGAAELVPPAETGALLDALERVVADGSLRRSLVARGRERAARFGWLELAAGIAATYRALAEGGPVTRRARRLREVGGG
jgi:glycosyltransferase involved in cell wall biosynthesis